MNAILQRVPARACVAAQSLVGRARQRARHGPLVGWLELNGFLRASTVREPGEYAVRGGIIDLYPAGLADPVRLDFFGDTLESIRASIRRPSAPPTSCARSTSCR